MNLTQLTVESTSQGVQSNHNDDTSSPSSETIIKYSIQSLVERNKGTQERATHGVRTPAFALMAEREKDPVAG